MKNFNNMGKLLCCNNREKQDLELCLQICNIYIDEQGFVFKLFVLFDQVIYLYVLNFKGAGVVFFIFV